DNIRAVNLSLSQIQPSDYTTSTLDAAVELLWKKGIVVVCSSGNLGSDSALYAPGNDQFVLTVGASDNNDTLSTADDALASFSSYGTTSSGFTKPDIVAPGRHIVAGVPGGSSIAQSAPAANVVGQGDGGPYVRLSGTSFSAPQVTGAVALLLQQNPQLTPDQVKWVLTHGERTLGGSNAGALDLGLAQGQLASPGNANAGVSYSSWAKPGALTSDFQKLGSLSDRAAQSEKSAMVWDRNAQTACQKAASYVGTQKTRKQGMQLWGNCAQPLVRGAQSWDEAASNWSQ